MADRDELLSQFTDVTGIDAERAKFYLESAAWQLEVRQYIMQVVSETKCNAVKRAYNGTTRGLIFPLCAGSVSYRYLILN